MLKSLSKKRIVSSYSILGFPSVIVACLWIGLWGFWPSSSAKTVSKNERITDFIFTGDDPENDILLRNLSSFIIPATSDMNRSKDLDSNTDRLSDKSARPPRFLDRNYQNKGNKFEDNIDPIPSDIFRVKGENVVQWNEKSVFSVNNNINSFHVVMAASETLNEMGFTPPEIPLEEVKDKDLSWLVVVNLDVDAKGKVVNVFVEKASAFPDVNAIVLRSMYATTFAVAKPGHGLVRVSYGL